MFTEDSVAIIDADSIYFRVACVVKKPSEIRKAISFTMDEIIRNTGCQHQLVAIKGQGNFRKDMYSKYKANRKDLDEDVKKALNYGHGYMQGKYDAIMADGMEADDLVSIWAYEAMEYEREYTIVGIDKDLLQIPGTHYNFSKKITTEVSADEADLKLMLQCLTGDTSDNIPGIKGIGPKKAEKILAGIPRSRRWSRVQAAWRGHKAGDPYLSRKLLTMLTTWKEFDAITQDPRKALVSERNVRSKR